MGCGFKCLAPVWHIQSKPPHQPQFLFYHSQTIRIYHGLRRQQLKWADERKPNKQRTTHEKLNKDQAGKTINSTETLFMHVSHGGFFVFLFFNVVINYSFHCLGTFDLLPMMELMKWIGSHSKRLQATTSTDKNTKNTHTHTQKSQPTTTKNNLHKANLFPEMCGTQTHKTIEKSTLTHKTEHRDKIGIASVLPLIWKSEQNRTRLRNNFAVVRRYKASTHTLCREHPMRLMFEIQLNTSLILLARPVLDVCSAKVGIEKLSERTQRVSKEEQQQQQQ